MPLMPSAAITRNHSSITGPNARPMLSVPNRCAANNTTRMATVIGMTNGFSDEVTTFTPSMALNTEIAGVITPSP